MLKEAIEKLVSLGENHIHEINGETYTEKPLERVQHSIDRPASIEVNGLDSIVKLIHGEYEKINAKIFVQVESYRRVTVFTTYGERFIRSYLYQSISDTPDFRFGWKRHEDAIIAIRSQFDQTDDTKYLLNLLSRITVDNNVSSSDEGVTQSVEVKKGVSLAQKEIVKPRVKLRPFRTFLEVEQPESEFLLRLNERAEIGLFEADGGMWKLKAKSNIAAYLEDNLKELVEAGTVVVMK